MALAGQGPGKSGAVIASAFYPEVANSSEALGSLLDLFVPTGGRRHMVLSKPDT